MNFELGRHGDGHPANRSAGATELGAAKLGGPSRRDATGGTRFRAFAPGVSDDRARDA